MSTQKRRAPLAPGPPTPLLGWLRQPSRRAGGRRIPISVVVGGMIAATVTLGIWGFSELALKPKLSFFESAYRAVRLYALELGPAAGGAGSGSPRPNLQLWLALALAAALVLRAAFALLRARLRRAAARYLLRGHCIVCGGGVHGTALVSALAGGRGEDEPAAEDHDVVLVDIDPGSPGMQKPLARREWRLVGDSVREETLLAAGAVHANSIVAMTGNDVVNSQIVSAVRSLAQKGKVRDCVHVLVQVEEPSLARFLEEESEVSNGESDSRLPIVSPFSANEIAADAVIRDSEVKLDGRRAGSLLELRDGKAPNLLLAGDHPLIDVIVLNVLRHWRVRILRDDEQHARAQATQREGRGPPPEHRPPLHVSIFGPDAIIRVERLRRLWQLESQTITIEARDSEPTGAELAELEQWQHKTHEWLRASDRADHVIVACLDELDGLRMTLDVSRKLGSRGLMTRVATQSKSALDRKLEERTEQSLHLATTLVRPIAELACNPSKMRGLAAQQRLADALACKHDHPGHELDPAAAAELSAALFERQWLELHSDSTWSVTDHERRLLEPLVRPADVSALVSAGLRVNLESPGNLRRAAEQLLATATGSDAFRAWCEYARHVDGDASQEIRAQLADLPSDPMAARVLALRAYALGDRGRLPVPAREHLIADTRRVVIFAGGAGSMVSASQRILVRFLTRALIDYDGVVLCGGTSPGLPGAVAQAASKLRLIGYVPRGKGDSDLYPRLRETDGEDFSERESLAMWEDILGSGIPLGNVRVVAFPGGEITTSEIVLARALGASIAWLDPADDALAPLGDLLAFGTDDIRQPPADPMTLRAFLTSAPPELGAFAPDVRERIAESLHNAYRHKQRGRKDAGDPALAPWRELIPSLRDSNLAQADDIPNKLALIGKRVSEHGSRLTLTSRQINFLAEVEHGRFNNERLSAGWQLGERQLARGLSPHLKSWQHLSEEIKDYDRDAVRNIDPALARVGWGVVDL